MKKITLLALVLMLGCTAGTEVEMHGKWYTYTESGDYMELWLGDDKAITYLSAIDEFLLYDLERDGSLMSFTLKESKRFDEHEFSLDVQQASQKLFQSIFVGGPRVDSLKTYFIVDGAKVDIRPTLEENQSLMNELFERLESGSHAGHGH